MKIRTRFLLLFLVSGLVSVLLIALLVAPISRFYEQRIDQDSYSSNDIRTILAGIRDAVDPPGTLETDSAGKESSMPVPSAGEMSTYRRRLAAEARSELQEHDGLLVQILGPDGTVIDTIAQSAQEVFSRTPLRSDRYEIGEIGDLLEWSRSYAPSFTELALVSLDSGSGSLLGMAAYGNARGFQLSIRNHGLVLLYMFLGAALLCIVGVTVGVTYLGTRSLLHRFDRLNTGLRRVLAGNYHYRVPAAGRDEVAFLTSSFNTMADGLARQHEERHRIISSLSHDLRTPLSSILGYAESLRDHPDDSTDSIAHRAEVIHGKAQHLGALLDELLDFSRSTRPTHELSVSAVDVHELLRRLVIGLLPDMKRKNMEPDIRFPDTQAVVHGDETLLSRAFENIIANAVKHGHEGSSVTVATAWIDPSPARKREPVSQQTTGPGTPAGAPHDREAVKTLQVDVTNVGPVIAPDRREAIFEAFRREDSSRSTPGLGLGLSIARRVLERHGGTVRVEHSDEHYTRFRAVTPVHPPAH